VENVLRRARVIWGGGPGTPLTDASRTPQCVDYENTTA